MFTEKTVDIIERALPSAQIKQRPGRGGMTFDYIPTEFVIRLLNEAFDYRWSTNVLESFREGSDVLVRLQLTVWDAENRAVIKEQYGSASVAGDVGDAYKAATSDALKKAATLLGIGLELYEQTGPADSRSTVSRAAAPAPRPPAPAAPRAPASVPAPVKANPFDKGVSRPVATPTATLPRPVAAKPSLPTPAAPRPNPFSKARQEAVGSTGPNSTQLNALTNIATRKNLSQSELIALAQVVDAEGLPVQSFDELTYEQAIKVIQAAQ